MNDLAPLRHDTTGRNGDRPLAISTRRLVKRFGAVAAVNGIDLDVPRGTIFAILGPNGAGKTTLMRMLATLTTPDEGTAVVMGHDLVAQPHQVRGAIAMTGQFASLDEDLTGRENLLLLARLWGFRGRAAKSRADDLLAAFELAGAANRQVKSYSGGMRRRLDIAASLIVTPGVLFLDEPTTGLDPSARQGVWRMIRAMAQEGVTILLTTQYLEEADQLADRIAVINRGCKIAEGTSRELKAAIGSGFLHVVIADPARLDDAARLLESRLGGSTHRNAQGRNDQRVELSIVAPGPTEANAALGALLADGIELSSFAMGSPSLEEVFFALTGDDAAPGGVAEI
jgi:ABC-2 type transport system ATP-binding protein